LFDKGFYFLLARDGLWQAWGNPERNRAAIAAFVAQRDSLLTAAVAPTGTKLYENDEYVIWRIAPPHAANTAAVTERPKASSGN
jgi:hypothetical protein